MIEDLNSLSISLSVLLLLLLLSIWFMRLILVYTTAFTRFDLLSDLLIMQLTAVMIGRFSNYYSQT